MADQAHEPVDAFTALTVGRCPIHQDVELVDPPWIGYHAPDVTEAGIGWCRQCTVGWARVPDQPDRLNLEAEPVAAVGVFHHHHWSPIVGLPDDEAVAGRLRSALMFFVVKSIHYERVQTN